MCFLSLLIFVISLCSFLSVFHAVGIVVLKIDSFVVCVNSRLRKFLLRLISSWGLTFEKQVLKFVRGVIMYDCMCCANVIELFYVFKFKEFVFFEKWFRVSFV